MITRFTSKTNPIILNTIQRIYLCRTNILNNIQVQPKNLETVFDDVNNFADGSGITVLKKFDDLFGLHQDLPQRQYELFNTTFVDSIYISSILELKTLHSEINHLINVLDEKASRCKTGFRLGHKNGAYIDMPISSMFTQWKSYLLPFNELIENHQKYLQIVPLGSSLETSNGDFQKKFDNNLDFEKKLISQLNSELGLSLTPASNRHESLSQLSRLVDMSGTLNSLASVLMKLANDVRFLASGPRSGFCEITIPENEPGSSIMPGKINPTQCESLTMVASQVIGNHTAVTVANSSALFESNCFKPLIANNILRSLRLLSDGLKSFRTNCAVGIELNLHKIEENLSNFKL